MYIRVPKFREDLKSLEVKIGIFFMKVTKLDDDGLTIYDLCTIAMVRIHFHNFAVYSTYVGIYLLHL